MKVAAVSLLAWHVLRRVNGEGTAESFVSASETPLMRSFEIGPMVSASASNGEPAGINYRGSINREDSHQVHIPLNMTVKSAMMIRVCTFVWP